MKDPDASADRHDAHDDDLKKLFAGLRAAPPAADPEQVARGFESRVLARVHTRAAAGHDALRWFWRWSAVFGTAAVVCVALAIQNYTAMTDDSFAAIESGLTLLDWFY